MKAFVIDHNLASSPLSAVNHELYLSRYEALNPEKKIVELDNMIKVLDGLGCNPIKISQKGYVGLLSTVHNAIDPFKEQLKKLQYQSFNNYLYNKGRSFGLDNSELNFLVDESSNTTPWKSLNNQQKQTITKIIWSSPFIFVKPPLNSKQVTEEFINQWNSGTHDTII